MIRILSSTTRNTQTMTQQQSFRFGSTDTSALIQRLRSLDTACLCDADKSLVAKHNENSGNVKYSGLRLVQGLKPLNPAGDKNMVGTAHTVRFTKPNDFLPVMQALAHAAPDEVLVANTLDSTTAVAGGLFGSEAERRGVAGIVVDGPMRDTSSLQSLGIRCYSRSVTPYSGTVRSLGEFQVDIECGGVKISPGDVVVGDGDGIVVASVEDFKQIVDTAEHIQALESNIAIGISKGVSLHSMTNYAAHLEALKRGEKSSLQLNGVDDDVKE